MSNDAFGAMVKGWEAFLRGYARLLGPEQYESNYNRKRINNRIYLAKRANSIEIFFFFENKTSCFINKISLNRKKYSINRYDYV